jgi:DNA-binding protein
MEIEGRQNEIERISDAYYEIKRQNEIFKTTIENIKYESEKIIGEIKERHRVEIIEL